MTKFPGNVYIQGAQKYIFDALNENVLRKGSKQNLFELMRFPQIRFIAQKLNEKLGKTVKLVCKRIGVTQTPIPSTRSLAKYSYPNKEKIIRNIEK